MTGKRQISTPIPTHSPKKARLNPDDETFTCRPLEFILGSNSTEAMDTARDVVQTDKDTHPKHYGIQSRSSPLLPPPVKRTSYTYECKLTQRGEEEDLAELEELTVPKPTPGTTKYATGYLTTSGWHSINEPKKRPSLWPSDDDSDRFEEPYLHDKYFDSQSHSAHVEAKDQSEDDEVSAGLANNIEKEDHMKREEYSVEGGGNDMIQGKEGDAVISHSAPDSPDKANNPNTSIEFSSCHSNDDLQKATQHEVEAQDRQTVSRSASAIDVDDELSESGERSATRNDKSVVNDAGMKRSNRTGGVQEEIASGSLVESDGALDKKVNSTMPKTAPKGTNTNTANTTAKVRAKQTKETSRDSNDGCEWELVGDDIESPRTGTPAPEKLRVHLRHKITDVEEVNIFKKMKEYEVDWNDKAHIKAISGWRRQIFRRKGFPLRKVNVMYVPDEDAWLELLHEKIKAVAEGDKVISQPSIAMIRDRFNKFFNGKMLIDARGKKLPPREPRDSTSFQGKFIRKGWKVFKLREDTRKLLEGKGPGTVYLPTITEEELQQYRTDGTFTVDDPEDAAKNASLRATSVNAWQVASLESKKRKRQIDVDQDDNLKNTSEIEESPKAKRIKMYSTSSSQAKTAKRIATPESRKAVALPISFRDTKYLVWKSSRVMPPELTYFDESRKWEHGNFLLALPESKTKPTQLPVSAKGKLLNPNFNSDSFNQIGVVEGSTLPSFESRRRICRAPCKRKE